MSGVVENFYVKVINIENEYIKNINGSDKIFLFNIIKIESIIIIFVFEVLINIVFLIIDIILVEEIVRIEGIVMVYFVKEEFLLEILEVVG